MKKPVLSIDEPKPTKAPGAEPTKLQRAHFKSKKQMPVARTVDVQTFLNEHPFSRFQWVIFAA
jgi:hypothetical protein